MESSIYNHLITPRTPLNLWNYALLTRLQLGPLRAGIMTSHKDVLERHVLCHQNQHFAGWRSLTFIRIQNNVHPTRHIASWTSGTMIQAFMVLYRAIAITRYKKCRATGYTAAHAGLPTSWKCERWSWVEINSEALPAAFGQRNMNENAFTLV